MWVWEEEEAEEEGFRPNSPQCTAAIVLRRPGGSNNITHSSNSTQIPAPVVWVWVWVQV